MQVQKINNQSFGMSLRYDYCKVCDYIYRNCPKEVNDTLDIVRAMQSKNPVDISVYVTKNKKGREVLCAEVDYRETFTEGFWRSAKGVLLKAAKRADKIRKERENLDRILNRPV